MMRRNIEVTVEALEPGAVFRVGLLQNRARS